MLINKKGIMKVELKPYDDCCYSIRIKGTDDSGMWCPKSSRVVMEGRILHEFCRSKKEVIERLTKKRVYIYALKEE